jgi:hypothetical protein
VDFQGAHSVLGSASHSGFGKEPAIVVGNSMCVLLSFYDLGAYLPCLGAEVQHDKGRHGRAKTPILAMTMWRLQPNQTLL